MIDSEGTPFIKTIEWNMMDKRKFYPLSMMSSFSIRCLLYPLTVVKTRIQIQRRTDVYKGTFDALQKIFRHEGFEGLYKGFWINTAQIISGVFYITTYENVRHFLHNNDITNNMLKGMVGGGCASVVGQTIIVPFDVISQHMMVHGVAGKCPKSMFSDSLTLKYQDSKARLASLIIQEIYRIDGFKGFYRGYFASLCAYAPNSALWWSLYHFYQDNLLYFAPPWMSHLLIQCISAPLGGITSALLTNPLDIIRARLQVQRIGSYYCAAKTLWTEEKFDMFTKGLSARMVQSCCFSFFLILGYETIKRWSIKSEYKDGIKW